MTNTLDGIAPHTVGADEGRSLPHARRWTMPLTGLLLFAYVVSVVLFSENPATSRIVNVVGFSLALVFVIEMIGRRGNMYFPMPLVWLGIFFCFCVFQMIWAPGSISRLMTLVELIVFAVIVVNYSTSQRGFVAIEYGFYFGVICTFIYNVVAHPPVVDGRIGSLLINANTYSLVLMIGVLFAFRNVLLRSIKHTLSIKVAVAFLLYFSLSIYGIVYLSGSRKGILLTIAAGVVLALYWIWHQPVQRRTLLCVSTAIVFAVVGYVLYRSPQFSRITDLSNFIGGQNVRDTGLTLRSSLFKDAVNLWLQRPFTGWGLDQFRVASGTGTYAHDNYVELLANQGVFGFLAYMMIYVSAFVSLIRSLRFSRDIEMRTDLFWALTVLGVAVAWDLGAVSYYDKLNWLVLSVVIAVAVRATLRMRAASTANGTRRTA